MTLSELLAGAGILAGHEHLGLDVSGVESDSRRVTPGCAFFAVRGAREDGAAFIPAAVENGARAIVGETPPAQNFSVPFLRVASSRGAAWRAACAWHGHPSRHMRVHGVTGTNGKTTTAGLVQTLLETAGVKTGLISTVETGWPGNTRESANTTPGPFELQRVFADMRAAQCAAVAMEVSSHAADQERAGGARFHAAGFTNLTQDHLDYHGDMDRYLAAKQKFFASAARENPACAAVVNGDDPYGGEMAAFCDRLGLRVLRFGFDPRNDLAAESPVLLPDGARFTLRSPWGSVEIHSRLCGRFNIANFLCAAGMVLAAGDANLETVARGASRALPRWGRLERVGLRAPFHVFVDYAHTPDALQNVLATLREFTTGKLIVVFGCGGDRDRAKRPLMGGIASRLADRVIVTSDNPRSEDPGDIIREICAGIADDAGVLVEPDRRAAIRVALSLAAPGDTVLIAGKGHERGQIFAGHTEPFDDRETVRGGSILLPIAAAREQDAPATSAMWEYFNPFMEIKIQDGGDLPHWTQSNVWYFITCRLADALPKSVVDELKEQRERWKETHDFDNLSQEDLAEYYRLFAERYETLLNAGSGSCLLKDPVNAKIVSDAFRFFEHQRYELDEFVVMSNHVHVLVRPLGGHRLHDILHSWKSFTANKINKRAGRTGQLWQHESYGHIVRNERAMHAIRKYIRENPTKVAGASCSPSRLSMLTFTP